MRASANASYENAAKDVFKYTGMSISASTQQRIVQRFEFPEIEYEQEVEEISVVRGASRASSMVERLGFGQQKKVTHVSGRIIKPSVSTRK